MNEREELLKRAELMLSCWSPEEQEASGRLSMIRDLAAYLRANPSPDREG